MVVGQPTLIVIMTFTTLHMMISLACAIILQGAMTTGLFVGVNQTYCHGNDAILSCPFYEESNTGNSLRWRIKDPVSNEWENLALIRRGRMRVLSSSQRYFGDRLTLHGNGSLAIKSLKEHDETHYQCIVSARGKRDVHLIELSIACHGQTTVIKQEVCTEENVTLECDAKHRANPSKIKRVMWHKKDSDGVWSMVAASDRGDLGQNSSLVLQAGRKEGKEEFRCAVSKNYTRSRDERHLVVLTNIQCRRERASIKTTSGRAAFTASIPLPETTKVSMATEPTAAITIPSEASKVSVCGGSLTSVSGGFQSPNFPSSYPANSYCKWTISVPQDYAAIDITLDNMNVEHEENCQNDYISIYDGLGNQVGCRQCGVYRLPIATIVRGRQAVVVFKSDSTEQRTGFKLTYTAAKDTDNSIPN